jgi:hypothetical protein
MCRGPPTFSHMYNHIPTLRSSAFVQRGRPNRVYLPDQLLDPFKNCGQIFINNQTIQTWFSEYDKPLHQQAAANVTLKNDE